MRVDPKKPAVTEYPEIDLSTVLREEMSRRGMRYAREVAELLGITRAYASQLLNGRRVGYRKVGEFAGKLGISLGKFARESFLVPIIGELVWGETGIMLRNSQEAVLTGIDLYELPGISYDHIADLYAMQVRNDQLLPFFKAGDLLVAYRNSVDLVSHGDKVIFQENQEDFPRLNYVEIIGSQVILKSFNPAIPSIILANRHAAFRLDKIKYVISR
ncbi:MAG: XRE family transcriptional regulator [Deltaproteobacteria bacterium]|nr:XRE family transcriptional regulator [Deltaproteobacteria bacterium]